MDKNLITFEGDIMKKILNFTFQRADNYGAQLQAFALQQFLENNGYECKICDCRISEIEEPYKVVSFKDKNPLKLIKQIGKLIVYGYSTYRRKLSFNKFRDEYLNLTESVYNVNDLKNIKFKPDVCITGSDQVWNQNIVGELSDFYALNFDSDAKKVSYAASVGDIAYIDSKKDEFINKLSKIDSMSVREKDATEVLSKLLNKQIQNVIDPTLLLTSSEWNDKLSQLNDKEEYIFTYYVSSEPEYFDIVNYFSKLENKKVVHCSKKKSEYKCNSKSIYDLGPMEFVNYIKNSSKVVTTSFHATVFSIVYHKEFFVVLNKHTGSRIKTLLGIVGLEDRIVYNVEDLKSKLENSKKIDWEIVDKKILEERKKSAEWLISVIENE